MKKNILSFVAFLFCLALLCPPGLSAQGWYYERKAPANTTWRPNDVIETRDHNFLISYWDYASTSTIAKLSNEGQLLSEMAITIPDTTIIVSKLFQDERLSCYTAMGVCIPSLGGTEAVLVIQFNEDLEIIRRKVVSCIGMDRPLLNMMFLKHNGGFKVAVSENDNTHHLAKFSLDGDLLDWQELEIDSLLSVCNLFEIVGNESCFGLYGRISNNSLATMGVLVFDDSLHLVSRTHFSSWQSEEMNGNVSLYYLSDLFNSMMIPVPDQSGYFVSTRLKEELLTPSSQTIHDETSALVAKTDLNFVLQDNYHIIEHFNDTIEYPAFYKSIDYCTCFNSSIGLFHCCMMGFDEGWPYNPSTVIVTKLDEDFNVVWKKYLLTGLGYSPFAITATSDEGCIVVGWVYDFNTENRFDLFALKINADGMVGVNESGLEVRPYCFYPNPVQDQLQMQFSPDVQPKQIELYDLQGRLVRTQRSNFGSIDMSLLPAGTYMMRVTLEDGTEFSDKMVKE